MQQRTPENREERAGSSLVTLLLGYLHAILAVAAATAVGWPMYHGFHLPDPHWHPLLRDTNILMFYLLAVLWVATRQSRHIAIFASILSVAAFDFCFTQPFLSFGVEDEQYIVTFIVMLIAAIVISTLTANIRQQSAAARQAWERAEAEFLRNTLLSAVSHDLRTPIAGITGAATTLLEADDKLSPATKRELLESIATEAEHMEHRISSLLNMTRLDAGGVAVARDWHPIQEIIGDALQSLGKRLRNRKVQTRIEPDLPLVYVDARAIEQVIANLADNSVEYTPPEGRIEISAARSESNLLLTVADSGPGLPPGTEQRVFEKFFRAPVAGRPSSRGLGLGLAICKGIVQAHGGTISARNRNADGGAEFVVSLPLSLSAPAVDGSA